MERCSSVTVTNLGSGAYLVADDNSGQQDIVYVAGTGHEHWAFWNGHVFRVRPAAGPARVPESRGAVGPVTAPMPGTIRKVLVEPGQRVAAGDPLLVLEAMKMEQPIRALDDGIVAAVRCREGELVQADAVLIEFVSAESTERAEETG
jgi:acetyl/propionyl-CoA carboxylase alpha subunit